MTNRTQDDPNETALVPSPAPGALTHVADAPLPIYSGAQMAQAMTAYRELQTALDRSMPDAIMVLDGKPFRKKAYWRAVAVAFGVSVEPISEERQINGQFQDGKDNFGYIVTYAATAPNGRKVSSDGSCFAVEKGRRGPDMWNEWPRQATEHNVRAHAHTRAFNRAVSNLVAFGEVTAEEVMGDEREDSHVPARPAVPSAPGGPLTIKTVTDREVKGGAVQFSVTFSDGVVASTINRRLGDSARELAAKSATVVRKLEQKGKWTNLVAINEVAVDEPVHAPSEDEIPF